MSDEEVRHSPEPWVRDPRHPHRIGEHDEFGLWIAMFHESEELMEPIDEANLERALLCVNALAGIPSAAIESGQFGDFLEERGLAAGLRWVPERDRLLAEIERLKAEVRRLTAPPVAYPERVEIEEWK